MGKISVYPLCCLFLAMPFKLASFALADEDFDFAAVDDECKTTGSRMDSETVQVHDGSPSIYLCKRMGKKNVRCKISGKHVSESDPPSNQDYQVEVEIDGIMALKSKSGNNHWIVNFRGNRFVYGMVKFVEAGAMITKNCTGVVATKQDLQKQTKAKAARKNSITEGLDKPERTPAREPEEIDLFDGIE